MNIQEFYDNKYNDLIENEIKYIYSLISNTSLINIINIINKDLKKIDKLLKIEFGNKLSNTLYNKLPDKLPISINNHYLKIISDTEKIDVEIKYLYYELINSYKCNDGDIIALIIINAIILYLYKDFEEKHYIYKQIKDTDINIIKNNTIINFIKLFDTIFERVMINNINYSYEINIVEPKINDNVIMTNFYKTIKNLNINDLENEF